MIPLGPKDRSQMAAEAYRNRATVIDDDARRRGHNRAMRRTFIEPAMPGDDATDEEWRAYQRQLSRYRRRIWLRRGHTRDVAGWVCERKQARIDANKARRK